MMFLEALLGFLISAVMAICGSVLYHFIFDVGTETDTTPAASNPPTYADIVGSSTTPPSVSVSQAKGSEKQRQRPKKPSYAEVVKRGISTRMQAQRQRNGSRAKSRGPKLDKNAFTTVRHTAASNRRFSPATRLTAKPVVVSNGFGLLLKVSPSRPRRHKPKRRHAHRRISKSEERTASTPSVVWRTVGQKKRWHRPLCSAVVPILPIFNGFLALGLTNDYKMSWHPSAVSPFQQRQQDMWPSSSATHRQLSRHIALMVVSCIYVWFVIGILILIPVSMDIVGDAVSYRLVAFSFFESVLLCLYKLVSRRVFAICKKMRRIVRSFINSKTTLKKAASRRRRVQQVSRLRRPRRHYLHLQQSSRHDDIVERTSRHCKLSSCLLAIIFSIHILICMN